MQNRVITRCTYSNKEEGNGGLKTGPCEEGDFAHAITLLMVRRILTGCGGSHKGNANSFQNASEGGVCLCLRITAGSLSAETSYLRDWVKRDIQYSASLASG